MKKYLLILGIIASLFGVGMLAQANPSFFVASTRTATATTTKAYITSGNATTTLSIDAYTNGGGVKLDKALVDFQMTATGTAPVLLARVERSNDNVDWYSETIETTTATAVTTYAPKSLSFTFASSSAYLITPTPTRLHESFIIDTPTRYTRVVFYSTNANAFDLWAEIQPYKQKSE